MFKRSLVTTTVLAIFLSGCSSSEENAQYKREVDGSDAYLQTSALVKLNVPDGMVVPAEKNDYFIYHAIKEGATGKQLDILPPDVPLAMIDDSEASYSNGVVYFDAPVSAGYWSELPSLLSSNYIQISQSDASTIKTGVRAVALNERTPTVEASYLINRNPNSSRDTMTFQLLSLSRNGTDISSKIEGQRYTVEFFNTLMKTYANKYIKSVKPQKQLEDEAEKSFKSEGTSD